MARSTFPLRFSHDRLRELVRHVAEREGISQNELLEQAAEHEVVARGALLADELEVAALALRQATATASAGQTQASIAAFAEAEAHPEPLRPSKLVVAGASAPGIGAVAAFKRS